MPVPSDLNLSGIISTVQGPPNTTWVMRHSGQGHHFSLSSSATFLCTFLISPTLLPARAVVASKPQRTGAGRNSKVP